MTMSSRSTETMITFSHPFRLTALDQTQPAGTYRLITDEDEVAGLSFSVFRRTATMLHVPAIEVSSRPKQVVLIDPNELDEILAADSRPA